MKNKLSLLSDRKIINIIRQSGYKQYIVADAIDYNKCGLSEYFSRGYLTKNLRAKLEKFISDKNLY